jgi:hypothetical protein
VQASLATPRKTEFDLATTALVGTVVTHDALDTADPWIVIPEGYVPASMQGGASSDAAPER